jgi:hypothetical protein
MLVKNAFQKVTSGNPNINAGNKKIAIDRTDMQIQGTDTSVP